MQQTPTSLPPPHTVCPYTYEKYIIKTLLRKKCKSKEIPSWEKNIKKPSCTQLQICPTVCDNLCPWERMWDPIPLLILKVYIMGCHKVKSFHIRSPKCCQSELNLCQKCLGEALPQAGLCVQHQLPHQQTQLGGKHFLMQVHNLVWVKSNYNYWGSVIISAIQLTFESVPCSPFKH